MSDIKLRCDVLTTAKSRIIVMNKIPNGSDMIFDLFGKRLCFSYHNLPNSDPHITYAGDT